MRLDGIEAALIDLDGTLVDTAGDFVAALGAMLDDLGLARVERPLVERLIGKGADHIVREALAAAGCGSHASPTSSPPSPSRCCARRGSSATSSRSAAATRTSA